MTKPKHKSKCPCASAIDEMAKRAASDCLFGIRALDIHSGNPTEQEKQNYIAQHIARHYRELDAQPQADVAIHMDIATLAELAEREKRMRELVLAAREIGWAMPKVFPATDYSSLVCESCHGTGEHQSEIVHDDSCPWQRLRAALEQFKEVK